MMTVKQIERAWTAKTYTKLLRDVLVARVEASVVSGLRDVRIAAAAIGVIRLDELGQSHVKVAGDLLRAILSAQETDGGWGDPATAALCVRALLCSAGGGVAIERGMAYLATLQKPQGIWPSEPIRRMAEDARVSAFILYCLGQDANFRRAVRLDDALAWFAKSLDRSDAEARRLFDLAQRRCRLPLAPAVPALWQPATAA